MSDEVKREPVCYVESSRVETVGIACDTRYPKKVCRHFRISLWVHETRHFLVFDKQLQDKESQDFPPLRNYEVTCLDCGKRFYFTHKDKYHPRWFRKLRKAIVEQITDIFNID